MTRARLVLFAGLVASAARAEERDPNAPPRWNSQSFVTPEVRTWGGATFAHLSGERLTYAGGSFAAGAESYFSVSPAINRWFYGSMFGVEARARVLHSIDAGSESWLVAGGLAFSSFVSPSEISRRLRFAGLFAVLVPEIGVAFRNPEADSFSLRWSAPVAWLATHHVAVEVVPAMTWLTHTASGDVEVLWELTLGVSWRELGPLPRPI